MTRWLRSFGAFWYDFVIGDDWRGAAAVVLALALTAVLVHGAGLNAWWLLPAGEPDRSAGRGQAERYPVVTPPLADKRAGRVVIGVRVGVRLGLLEHRGVVHRPLGRVAR
jgi:hypothetical protein